MRSSVGSRLHAGSTSGNSTRAHVQPTVIPPTVAQPTVTRPTVARIHVPQSFCPQPFCPRSFFPCSSRAHLQGSRPHARWAQAFRKCSLGSRLCASDPRSLESCSRSSPCALKEHEENECLEDSGLDGGHGDGGRLRWTRRRQTRHRRTRRRRQWREPCRRGQDVRSSACGVRHRAWVSYCLTRERQGRGRLTRQTSRRQAGAGANLPANSRRSVVMDILVARGAGCSGARSA